MDATVEVIEVCVIVVLVDVSAGGSRVVLSSDVVAAAVEDDVGSKVEVDALVEMNMELEEGGVDGNEVARNVVVVTLGGEEEAVVEVCTSPGMVVLEVLLLWVVESSQPGCGPDWMEVCTVVCLRVLVMKCVDDF